MPTFSPGQLVLAKPERLRNVQVILGEVTPANAGTTHTVVRTGNNDNIVCLTAEVVALGTGGSFGMFRRDVAQMCQDPKRALHRGNQTHHYLLCRIHPDGSADAIRLEDNQLVVLTKEEVVQLQKKTVS